MLLAALLAESSATVLLALIRLQALELADANFDDWGPAGLGSLTALTHLQLPYSCMRARGAAAITALPAVVRLSVTSAGLNNQAVQALAFMTGLQELNLGCNELAGAAGGSAVAQLPGLTALDIYSNALGDAGMQMLATLTSLRCLSAMWVGCGNPGLLALAQLTHLTCLDFGSFTAGYGRMQALAPLTALHDLYLGGAQLIQMDAPGRSCCAGGASTPVPEGVQHHAYAPGQDRARCHRGRAPTFAGY